MSNKIHLYYTTSIIIYPKIKSKKVGTTQALSVQDGVSYARVHMEHRANIIINTSFPYVD